MNTTNLQGKLVLVTGAGSGIGRETALLCAERGAHLAICDLDEGGLAETTAAARVFGREVLEALVDVTDTARMDAFACTVHERFGAVDLLVNNAGIGVVASFFETTPSDWERLISINLMGVVNGCERFVPPMIERGRGGHVVNVASMAGYIANPALCAYSATKFAVFGFTEALRVELRPYGIGVTAVCPGIIDTAITQNSTIRGASSDERKARIAQRFKRRGYTPQKVATNILRAAGRNRAVAPIAPEAHALYALTRIAPPAARWLSERIAAAAN